MPAGARIQENTMKENSEKLFLKKEGMLWRPVFTLARNEKKIYALLKEKGIDAYLPLRTHVNIQPVISKGKTIVTSANWQFPCFRIIFLHAYHMTVVPNCREIVP